MKPIRQRIWGYLFLCVISLAAGCAGPGTRSEWPEMRGKVVDLNTKKPIEGVVVVAFWVGYGGHSKICFHSERSTTNLNGDYIIPAWINDDRTAESVTYQKARIDTAYKTGYRYSKNFDAPPSDEGYKLHYLSPDASDNASRLTYLSSIPTHCDQQFDDNAQQAWPLLETIFREASTLPITRDDKYKVRLIVRSMVYLSDEDPMSWYDWNYQESLDYAEKKLEIINHGKQRAGTTE